MVVTVEGVGGNRNRYEALDSFRGLCACSVVLFHLSSTGTISRLTFVGNAWLLVDFFFVLSGFVIGASYGRRLREGFPLGEFMLLRVGRVYPLHLAMLLAFLMLELAGALGGTAGTTTRVPFTDSRTLSSFFSNLLMLQIFGLDPMETWNGPSWSIAAELWTYLVVAIGLARLGDHYRWMLAAMVVLSPAILLTATGRGLDVTFSLSLFRCFYSFAIGMLCFDLFKRVGGSVGRASSRKATLIECLVLLVTILPLSVVPLVSVPPYLPFVFPWLFAAIVLVFADGRGLVSRGLLTRPLRFLGTVSYSVYMVHFMVVYRITDVLTMIGRHAGIALTNVGTVSGRSMKQIAGPGIFPDLAVLAALAITVAIAWLSYRFIETPCRDWSRKLAVQLGHRRARLAEQIAPTF